MPNVRYFVLGAIENLKQRCCSCYEPTSLHTCKRLSKQPLAIAALDRPCLLLLPPPRGGERGEASRRTATSLASALSGIFLRRSLPSSMFPPSGEIFFIPSAFVRGGKKEKGERLHVRSQTHTRTRRWRGLICRPFCNLSTTRVVDRFGRASGAEARYVFNPAQARKEQERAKC